MSPLSESDVIKCCDCGAVIRETTPAERARKREGSYSYEVQCFTCREESNYGYDLTALYGDSGS